MDKDRYGLRVVVQRLECAVLAAVELRLAEEQADPERQDDDLQEMTVLVRG